MLLQRINKNSDIYMGLYSNFIFLTFFLYTITISGETCNTYLFVQ